MDTDPTHHIDRHILRVLTFAESARYRDLRPEGTDSNLFNYHRKTMIKQGFIKHNPDKSYSLDTRGLLLAERVSFADLRTRDRPKLSVALLIKSSQGNIAVWKKRVQPYIDTTNLPNGKMRLEDSSVMTAAKRTLQELKPAIMPRLEMKGVADVCVMSKGETLTHTVNMVVKVNLEPGDISSDIISWVDPKSLDGKNTTPGLTQTIADFLESKQYAYKNYLIELQ